MITTYRRTNYGSGIAPAGTIDETGAHFLSLKLAPPTGGFVQLLREPAHVGAPLRTGLFIAEGDAP